MNIKTCNVVVVIMLSVWSQAAAAVMNIETSTQDIAAIAKVMGGEYVDVHSLTQGTRDPHFAVAKPSMIRKVYQADLLIVIGAEMELGWMPLLLKSSRNANIQPGQSGHLDLSRSVVLSGKLDGPVSRDKGDVHSAGNPHYWLDPRNGVRMAYAISQKLSELDAKHAELYLENYSKFKKMIEEKYSQWQAELSFLKDQPVIAYHTSFVYLANAFGFKIVDEVESVPGIAPGAASLAGLVGRIKQDRIKWLIMEPFYERRSAEYLMQQTGIKLAILPQSVGAESQIKQYSDLFDSIVASLKAVKGKE